MSEHPRMKARHMGAVTETLTTEFSYKNRMQVPTIHKVVVNIGLGEAVANPKAIDSASKDLMLITGQKPVTTKAKKSVASFKIREGMPIGAMVTLRGVRMWEFVDRLISVALPRIQGPNIEIEIILSIGSRRLHDFHHIPRCVLWHVLKLNKCIRYFLAPDCIHDKTNLTWCNWYILGDSSYFHNMLPHVRRFAASVTFKGPRGSKFTELVPDHILTDEYRYVAASIVYRDRKPDEVWEYRRCSRPRLDDGAFLRLKYLFNLAP